MDEADLTFLIGQKIFYRGTPAQPFMQPALEDNRANATRRVDRAVEDALEEIANR